VNDENIADQPPILKRIREEADALGFKMSCDDRVGALLRTLATARPRSRVLELGTGAGVSTAWILAGMDNASTLLTVDDNAEMVAVARRYLAEDSRVTIVVEDGGTFLQRLRGQTFDLIFADTWPGKFWALEECLDLLAPGGLYVIDDLLPQETWPEGHGLKVVELINKLQGRSDLAVVQMRWASGVILAAKR
jgi:predicted O-methyltransferase YrrM